MSRFDDYLDMEENFQPNGKRASRKERHKSRACDRSQYKKTDQDKKMVHMTKRKTSLASNHKRGRVLTISSKYITVATKDHNYFCILKGTFKKKHTKQMNRAVVGDWVHFEPKDHHFGVITHIEKRSSFLSRADNFFRRKEHLIAVNIDQVFIVTSVMSPKLKPLLVDRYILSAIKGHMKPIILINKIDLLIPLNDTSENAIVSERASLTEFLHAYSPLPYPIIQLSASNGRNLAQLRALMQGKTSVFSGQSGVGKSSLINAILGTTLSTGKVAKKTQKGSHTTPASTLIPFEGKGFCIDTPGIKSFGIYNVSQQDLLLAFPDFIPYSLSCKFPNCTHIHEPDCAVKKGVETHEIHPLRYNSYTALFQEILSNNPWV